jgi:hypothetical protein
LPIIEKRLFEHSGSMVYAGEIDTYYDMKRQTHNCSLLQSILPRLSGIPIMNQVGLLLLMLSGTAAGQLFTEIDPGLAKPPNPCVIWGDYDSDGDLDVLVAGVGKQDVAFTTIYNNAGGVFTNSGINLSGLSRASAAWGDYDNDGDLDLAITGLTTAGVATMRIYRNDGGTFTAIPGSFIGVFAGNVAWADYDNDGDLDLLVTGVTSSTPGAAAATKLYRNDGGVFTSVTHPFPNCYLGAVSWGDFDNDGDLDVIITGTESTGALVSGLWRNNNGTFTDAGAHLPGMDLGFAVWGDYDSDGDLDLLFGGNSDDGWITRIYRNDSGTLVLASSELLGLIWSSAAWGDYDNDGDLDFIVAGYDPVAQVHRSILYRNEAGFFVDSGATFHNVILGSVSWADFDNDGDLDLLIAGNENGQDIVSIYRNNNLTSNTAPTAPTNLAVSVLGTSVDFSWSAASDAETPAEALSYNLRVGTTPGGADILAPQSSNSGYRRLPEMGGAQLGLSARLAQLKPGINYFWSVQAVDTAFAGSAFATEGTFTASADVPVTVSIVPETTGSVRVTWLGTPGSPYYVLTSTNFSTWSLMSTQTADLNGLFDIIEPTSLAPVRFFRAAKP